MTTTTDLGGWGRYARGYRHIEDSVSAALDDPADYDVDGLVHAYQNAINAALPPGYALCGSDFYGPAYRDDQHLDGYPITEGGDLDIAAIISGVDSASFWDLAARFDRTA